MSPGFTMVDNAVIARLPEIDGTAIKVFLALARRAGTTGNCWPSQPTIGVDTGLQVRAVRNALDRLHELGLISVKHHYGRVTVYQITPAPPCRSKDEGEAPPCRTPRHHGAGHPGTAVPPNNKQEQETENKRAPQAARAFVKPTLQEVTAYCQERSNSISAETFLDHYTANGWRVGKAPMKDWRAAVRTWERLQGQFSNSTGNSQPQTSAPIKYLNGSR